MLDHLFYFSEASRRQPKCGRVKQGQHIRHATITRASRFGAKNAPWRHGPDYIDTIKMYQRFASLKVDGKATPSLLNDLRKMSLARWPPSRHSTRAHSPLSFRFPLIEEMCRLSPPIGVAGGNDITRSSSRGFIIK